MSEWIALEQAIIITLTFIAAIIGWIFKQRLDIISSRAEAKEANDLGVKNESEIIKLRMEIHGDIRGMREELKSDHNALSEKVSERSKEIFERIERSDDKHDERFLTISNNLSELSGMMKEHWRDKGE